MKTKLLIFGIAVLCFSVTPAMADLPSLQQIFDYITVSPPSSVTAATDMLADNAAGSSPYDSYWNITASSSSVSTMIIEVAGFHDNNVFGVYELGNSGNKVPIFGGPTGPGGITGTATLTILHDIPNGGFDVYVGPTQLADYASSTFGFYLSGPGGTFYSDSSLNTDGQVDHMYAYQGTGDYVQIKEYVVSPDTPDWAYTAGYWTSNEYILAFEDLPRIFSDWDYNDFVVMIESVTPVPVPAAVLLGILGLGVAGLKLRKYA